MLAGAFVALSSPVEALSLCNGNIDIDVQSGWREDSFNYNTRGVDGTPNVAEERKYKNLRSFDTFGRIDYEWCNILLRGYGNYGAIYAGSSRNKTWAGDDRTSLTDDIKAESDRGEVFDYGVAIGYRLPMCYCDQHFVFTPLLGWSQHEQHLRQIHGQDVFGAGAGPLGEMHNSYQTRWYGPWLGYNLSYSLPCNFTLKHMFEWHWARFRADGKDHERDAADVNAVRRSFRQKDHGQGYLVGGAAEYARL